MTTNRTRIVALLAAVMLVTAVAVPAIAAADTTVSVSVDQDHDTGEAIVVVSQNGTAVENATVAVNATGNYSVNDTYTTDANGTVLLPAPEEPVTVELVAEYEGSNVTESVDLVPLEESLGVSVEQEAGDPATVTVTQYDDTVKNATVAVTAENQSYTGTGEYETNENGTVELPAPETTTNVSVEAAYNNLKADTFLTLEPAELNVSVSQDADGGVWIDVTEGGEHVEDGSVLVTSSNYTYAGTYDVDNGTVSLPAPTQNVSVSVTATVDERTKTTNTTLYVQTDDNPNNDFAEGLTDFIHFIKIQGVEGPLGQEISEYVHSNNPASADDNRGPPEHAGGSDDTANDTQGPPAVADDDNDTDADDRRGPPAHAGSNGDVDEDHEAVEDRDQDREDVPENETDDSESDGDDDSEVEEDDEEESESAESDDEERQGPPEHANGPR